MSTPLLNPYKFALWNLPDFPKDYEDRKAINGECIAIFPLFASVSGDASLEHHIVKSALWMRKSWFDYTDANNFDIAIKFYVESAVLDRVKPLMEMIHEDNIITFDGSEWDVEHAKLGKKLSFFCDPQFADYDWVVQIDSDLGIGSPGNKKLNFFQYILTHEKSGIGAVVASQFDEYTIDNFPHWYFKFPGSFEEQKRLWLQYARELVGDMVESYVSPQTPTYQCGGGIYAYSPEADIDAEFIKQASIKLQDDEAVVSVWALKGGNLWSMSDELGVPHLETLERIKAGRKNHTLYFSHLANTVDIYNYHKDLGVY